MSNKDKVYKLLLNLLDHNSKLSFVYDSDLKGYRLSSMSFNYGKYNLDVYIHDFSILDLAENICFDLEYDDEYLAVSFGTKEIDRLIKKLKNSYMNFLVKGID